MPSQAQPYVGTGASLHVSGVFFSDPLRGIPVRTGPLLGFDTGLLGGYIFSKYAALHTEFLYTQKGYIQQVSQEQQFKQTLHYLELHLATKVSLPIQAYALFLQMGVFGSRYLLDTQTTLPVLGLGEELYPYNKEVDNVLGYGLKGALGANVEILQGLLQLSVGYSFDLRDYLQADLLSLERPFESKLNAFYVSLNYVYVFD